MKKDAVISDDSKTWQDIVTKRGKDYRERERIKRKIQRWIDNLKEMSDLERRAFLAAMQEQGFGKPAEPDPRQEQDAIYTSAEGRMKLKRAGFRIFRAETGRNMIKEFSDKGSWHKHSEYKSSAAMQRAFKNLLADEKHVEA